MDPFAKLEEHVETSTEAKALNNPQELFDWLAQYLQNLKLHLKSIGSIFDSKDLREKMKQQRGKSLRYIKLLYQHFHSHHENNAKRKSDFNLLMKRLETWEQKVKEKIENHPEKTLPRVFQMTKRTSKKMSEKDNSFYQSLKVIHHEDKDEELDDDQEIEDLSRDVQEITEILQNLQTQTSDQSQMIDHVVDKTTKVKNDIIKGGKGIKKAHYLSAAGLMLSSVVLGGVIGGPVGAYVGYSTSAGLGAGLGIAGGGVLGGFGGWGLNAIKNRVSGVRKKIEDDEEEEKKSK